VSRKIPQYQILLRSLQRLSGWYKLTDRRTERFEGTIRITANAPKMEATKGKVEERNKFERNNNKKQVF
jgi:hypothetical protein